MVKFFVTHPPIVFDPKIACRAIGEIRQRVEGEDYGIKSLPTDLRLCLLILSSFTGQLGMPGLDGDLMYLAERLSFEAEEAIEGIRGLKNIR